MTDACTVVRLQLLDLGLEVTSDDGLLVPDFFVFSSVKKGKKSSKEIRYPRTDSNRESSAP